MSDYSFWSLLPPVLAIILAIRTKQVYIALLFGIWLGWVIIEGGNIFTGTLATVQALVDVFKSEGNTQTIMFSALVGSLIAFIQRSGGVEGFILKVEQLLNYLEEQKKGNSRVVIQMLALLTGMLIFVESSISVLTVGALYRPVFDKLRISREKLAYIADSTSAPSCILIPFNAWGAYIMGLLAMQGFDNPFSTLFNTIPYNFYPILAILLVIFIIFSGKNIGPMQKAEKRVREEGSLLAEGAQPMVSSDISVMKPKEGIRPRAINMMLPIAVMVGMMPLMLIHTGWGATEALVQVSLWERTYTAIGQGSGSAAVLYAVLTAIVAAMILYRSQKLMKTGEMIDLALKGIGGLMPLALLMLMAFAISNVCRSLGTGLYVAEISRAWLSPGLVPAIVFMVSSFIAFSTGTSWGTFAIMISISVPMAEAFGSDPHLAIAAALGGGIFGDHCSPISDTTILSSMASATDHIDHVKTQLPYALIAGAVAVGLYLVMGFLS
jgi:tetracycline resistance efflux pump